MNSPEPIPTPLLLHWREFRIKVLPPLVFVAILVLAVSLWVNHATPTALIGQVESLQANVSSTKPGLVSQIQVLRFSPVQVGQPIATIITTDPKVLEASLAVIRAEVQVLQLGMTPVLDQERDQIVGEKFRLNWLEARVKLAQELVQLHYAEGEYTRIASLYQNQTNIVTLAQYEIALRDRDLRRTEVEEQKGLVAEYQKGVEKLHGTLSNVSTNSSPDVLRAAIAVQEEKLKLTEAELSPLVLRAPIDGVVSMVHRRSGETVAADEPLVTITSTKAQRIIAYVRQPIGSEPQAGMEARVLTRSLKRTSAVGRVAQVMPYMEAIPRQLALPLGNNQLVEMGLPVAITLPPGLNLRVGELVDVDLLPPK